MSDERGAILYRVAENCIIVSGLVILAMTFYAAMKKRDIKAENERLRNLYTVQEKDLNGNGIPEIFLDIDGKKYFYSVDGKSIEDKLKEK